MEKNTNTKQKLEEAGALWKRTSKGSNTTYLNGVIKTKNGEEVKVIIFSNKYKEEGSNQPDYRVYFDTPIEQQSSTFQKKGVAAKTINKVDASEEIPF